jgi:hypothetical protein
MFFQKIPLQEFRRRRLRHLLLLALRCLAILALIAAFSQPILTDWLAAGLARPAASSLILVDNSLSMSRPPVWDRAMSAVSEEVDRLGNQDEALLAHFGSSNGTLTRWQRNKNVLKSAARESLKPSAGTTSYAEGLRFASIQFEQSSNPNRRIVLITDLQKSGINQAEISDFNIPADVSLEIRDVGEESRNFFISNMQIEREIFGESYQLPIIVQVSGPPDEKVQGELRFYLGDEVIQRREFQLSGTGPTAVQFDSFEIPDEITRGKVVTGFEDDLAEDDVFHFVIQKQEPFSALLFSGDSDDSLFFREAMESGQNLPFQIVPVNGTGQLEETRAKVIVLDDPERIPARDDLENFVQQGGGLVLAHGRRSEINSYRPLQELLPGSLVERHFARSFNSAYVFLDTIGWDHPVFTIFDASKTNLLDSIQFYGYWELQPSAESRVLASFNTGHPALLTRDFGKGRIYQVATSLGRSWTDFPLRSAYVPFWHQVIRHSANWNPRPDSYFVSDLFNLDDEGPTGEEEDSRNWELLDPSGRRVFSLAEGFRESIRFESPGFYEIRKDRETDWVAVNIDPRESDLSRITKEALINQFPFSPPTAMENPMPGEENEIPSQPVWWFFLVLSALLFLAEAIYSNRQRKKSDQFA